MKKIDLHGGRVSMAVLKPFVRLVGLLLRRNHDLTVGNELVFVKMLGGGSIVLAFPALLGLRKCYPTTCFKLVCTPDSKAFAELLHVFDEFVVIDDQSPVSLAMSSLSALRSCWWADTIVDFEVHSKLTTLFCVLTGARNRIGLYLDTAFWRKGLLTHLFFFNRSSGSHWFYKQIAQALGAPAASVEECRDWLMACNGFSRRQIEPTNRLYLGLGCFCSNLSVERMLGPEQWAKLLAERFADKTLYIVLFGGPADAARGEFFANVLRDTLPCATIDNWCGKHSLAASIERICSIDEFWGIDSGLLHFARLIGVKTTSFWGPTDPSTLLLPIPNLDEAVHYNKIPCSPCVHLTETPPCAGNNLCMKSLTEPLDEEALNTPWIVK